MTKLQLPLVAPHERALEKCVYCPKLSRAACPISNVEGNETVTPWGKMSLAYLTARGDVPIDEAHAEPAWACSACYGCRERCEHGNEVAHVLGEARAEYFHRGVAPPAARRAAAAFEAHAADYRRGVEALDPENKKSAATAVLIGCSYVRHAPDVARAIWTVTRRLAGGEVRALRQCCGLPLYHAGDRSALQRAAHQLCDEARGVDHVVVGDPGCARALSHDYPLLTAVPQGIVPWIDLVYSAIDRVPPGTQAHRRLRWHDPCQLGRGLGRYEEPRAVLARLGARPPLEMERTRRLADCSGGGGLLPLTRPETSAAMADERIAEHRRGGGGVLVTGCGASLRRFRSRGEPAVDLASLVAEALGNGGG
jgi:Fe-S oxidoreductase